MLKEFTKVSQDSREIGYRRWFDDEKLDLIIWYTPHHHIKGFQLCYHNQRDRCAFTWRKGKGFSHNKIDEGDDRPTKNRSPILVPDGMLDKENLIEEFKKRNRKIDTEISELVLNRINEFSNRPL